MTSALDIAVFEGDGIGPEIMAPTLDLIERALSAQGGRHIQWTSLPAGASAYKTTGYALPKQSVDTAREADAILLSAMGDPSVRYDDGTELIPQVDLRLQLGLYAGVRPVRSIPGVPSPLNPATTHPIDFVLIRESTEGLFAPSMPGTKTADQATETLLITREVSQKLFQFTFDLATQRQQAGSKGRVTCIDKANVFGAFAFFREIFDEYATRYPALISDHAYVDAMAMYLVTQPSLYDVMVTENIFGDILSDLGAALMGGMGYAPSADIGDTQAVFQPCHGSAPDIAGTGAANPTAMFLSGAMMLDWLGHKQQCDDCINAGKQLTRAVDQAFAEGTLLTCEHGGADGVAEVFHAVVKALDRLS